MKTRSASAYVLVPRIQSYQFSVLVIDRTVDGIDPKLSYVLVPRILYYRSLFYVDVDRNAIVKTLSAIEVTVSPL